MSLRFYAILDRSSSACVACDGYRHCAFIEASGKQVVWLGEHDSIGVTLLRVTLEAMRRSHGGRTGMIASLNPNTITVCLA